MGKWNWSAKFKIAIALAMILIFSIIVFDFFCNNATVGDIPVMNAVPIDAQVIIQSNKFGDLIDALIGGNVLWSGITDIESVNTIDKRFFFWDSIFNYNEDAEELIKHHPLIISLHVRGNNSLEFLFTVNFPNPSNMEKAESLIQNIFQSSSVTKISKRSYESSEIVCVVSKLGTFYYSNIDNFLILSYSSILVEDAIRQTRQKVHLSDMKDFQEVAKVAGKNVLANVYVNYKSLPSLFTMLFKKNDRIANNLNKLAAWSEFDLSLKNDALLMSGLTYLPDSSNYYLSIFRNQSPQNIEIESCMPANTSAFIALGINNLEVFKNDYRAYLNQSGKIVQYQAFIQQILSKTQIDIEEIFYSFLETEMALVVAGINTQGLQQNAFAVMRTKSKSMAQQQMLGLIDKIAISENKSRNSYDTIITTLAGNSYEFYRSPVKNLPTQLFGEIFAGVDADYFTFFDNYLIFGNSSKSLAEYIEQCARQNNLANQERYHTFRAALLPKSNLYLYADIPRSLGIVANALNKQFSNDFEKNFQVFTRFQAAAIQFNASKRGLFNTLYLNLNSTKQSSSPVAWESRLDTTSVFKPFFFVNHYTDDKEIFVQDLNNKVYLLNHLGYILWSKQIDEPILGNVSAIDYFNNGKLQLVFATQNQIHLLDRNGNYLPTFPVILASPAVSGLSVFDYNKDLDYRLFIACENKKVYSLTKEAKPVDGWLFNKTENQMIGVVQHFVINDKDYLIFADTHTTYILDRKGVPRVSVNDHYSKSINNGFLLDQSNPAGIRFITTDESGKIVRIDLNGKVTKESIRELTPNHYFDYQDINSDGYNDYIFCDCITNETNMSNCKVSTIEVFKHDKELLFSKTFAHPIDKPVVVYTFSANQRKIGAVSTQQNLVYLINPDGSVYEGFPRVGHSQFSIAYLSKINRNFNLIVTGDENQVFNYEIKLTQPKN